MALAIHIELSVCLGDASGQLERKQRHLQHFEGLFGSFAVTLNQCEPAPAYVLGPSARRLGALMPFARNCGGMSEIENGQRLVEKLYTRAGTGLGIVAFQPEKESDDDLRHKIEEKKQHDLLPWIITTEPKAESDTHELNAARFAKALQVQHILIVRQHPQTKSLPRCDIPKGLSRMLPGVGIGVHYLKYDRPDLLLDQAETPYERWPKAQKYMSTGSARIADAPPKALF